MRSSLPLSEDQPAGWLSLQDRTRVTATHDSPTGKGGNVSRHRLGQTISLDLTWSRP